MSASTKRHSSLPFLSPLYYTYPFTAAMGLLAVVLEKLSELHSTQSLWVLTSVGLLALFSVSVVVNVLRQILFKNPHEPPLVFHWFPFVGSTISYGMDPYKFFFESRAKVRVHCPGRACFRVSHLRAHCSTAISSLSFSWAKRPPSSWAPKAMNLFSTASFETSAPRRSTRRLRHPFLVAMLCMIAPTPNSWSRRRYVK